MQYDVEWTQKAKSIYTNIVSKHERYLDLFDRALVYAVDNPHKLKLYSNAQNPYYQNKYISKKSTCILVILVIDKDDINKKLTIIDIEVSRDPDCIILD